MKEIKHAMKDGMTDLDNDLKHALQREEPPAGFADRVLSRVAEPPQTERRARTLPFQSWAPSEHRANTSPLPSVQTWGPPLGGLQAVGAPATRSRLPFIQWAAAAALVAAVAGGADYIAKQEERAEGEAAKERVVQALHIAGTKLQLVQTRISRMHEPPAKNVNQ